MKVLATVLAGVASAACAWSAHAGPVRLDLVEVHRGGDALPLADILPEGPVVLHFWATWCGPCRAELPALEAYLDDLAATGRGGRLVPVSVDTASHARVVDFLREDLGLATLPAWQDATGLAGTVFALEEFPSTLALDADRAIAARWQGALDWGDGDVRSEVGALLAPTLPRP